MNMFERRRLLLAAAVTLVALPTLWWAKRDDPIAKPSVAAVDAGGGLAVATGSDLGAGAATPTPGYLDGPKDASVITPAQVVGPPAEDRFTRGGFASFRTFDPAADQLCSVSFLPTGSRITVEDTDNGKKTTCVVFHERVLKGIVVVLDFRLFVQLADLSEAPIPVRIRW
jgi:hypothetical protein